MFIFIARYNTVRVFEKRRRKIKRKEKKKEKSKKIHGANWKMRVQFLSAPGDTYIGEKMRHLRLQGAK